MEVLTNAGRVKVLDLRLAKVFTREPAGLDAAQTPTRLSGTMENAIMGTAAYMSPELEKANSSINARTSGLLAASCLKC